MNSYV
jgi:hypothetical protein